MPNADQPRPIGRRTALTRDVHEQIVDAARAGAFMEDAAASAGVHKSTLYRWMELAEHDEAPVDDIRPENRAAREAHWRACRDLGDALKEARGQAVVDAHHAIRRAWTVEGTWQAAAWFLERTDPARYSRRTVEVVGKDDGPVQLQTARSTIEGLLQDPEALAAVQAAAVAGGAWRPTGE
jgi:transposase-like protein